MHINIKLSAPNREIYQYMKEDQHQKEVAQVVPSYDVVLCCFEVLFGSRCWPLGPRTLTLYSSLENIKTNYPMNFL